MVNLHENGFLQITIEEFNELGITLRDPRKEDTQLQMMDGECISCGKEMKLKYLNGVYFCPSCYNRKLPRKERNYSLFTIKFPYVLEEIKKHLDLE